MFNNTNIAKQALRVCVGLCVLVGSAGNASATLFGFDMDSEQLVTINTATGTATAVGPTGIRLLSLAYDPTTQTMYGAANLTDQLVTLNTATGAATVVGGLGFDIVSAMAFDANTGTLYGHDNGNTTNNFLTINTATGAATAVGPGLNVVGGMAFDGSTSTLFAADAQTDNLFTFDTGTGLATLVGPSGLPPSSIMRSLAYDPLADILYSVDLAGGGRLITLDKNTGIATTIGPVGGLNNIRGLTFVYEQTTGTVPEPGMFALFGLGLAGLGFARRKRAA